MNNQIVAAESSFSPLGLNTLSGGAQRQTKREVERVAARTIVAQAHEQGRAMLANDALMNAASLSAVEAHLIEVAPLGESRYKHIVDSWTMGVAFKIQRW